MPEPDFNPRAAALYHAGRAAMAAGRQPLDRADEVEALAEATNGIVCGLVYVGDRIDALVSAIEGQ
jgi:hypothetical protein